MTPEQPSEQYWRMMMAVVLCLVAIWLYNAIFVRPPPRRRPPPAAPVPAQKVPTPDEEPPPGAPPETPEEHPPAVEAAVRLRAGVEPEEFEVAAGPYEMTWTNEGASLISLRLKEFFREPGGKEPLDLIHPIEDGKRSLVLVGLDDLERIPWKIVERGEGGRLVFETATRAGLVVTKTITLPDEKTHHLLIEIALDNRTGDEVKSDWLLRGPCGILEEKKGYGSEPVGLVALAEENGVETMTIRKVRDEPREISGKIRFVGIENKYFACLLLPLGAEFEDTRARFEALLDNERVRRYEAARGPMPKKERDLARNNMAASYGIARWTLPAGEKRTHRYLFFVGPKAEDLILSYAKAPDGVEGYEDPHFERILFRGLTGGISRFFVGVLTLIHALIPNWGIAIIILTLIVRSCLHPLNRKAQKSMHGMSKLKPQMDAIKEKYKGRKSKEASAKMQKEIFALYKEHGVNPAGGCLPMIFQFPIFIGLYWGINQAVPLRHAPFILWIKDLSDQDCLFRLPFTLPILGTDCFNVLPLLVITSWILQQKMQPKPADPQMQQQQKIMSYMLLFMGFIFYTVPSGLNLYFLTSATLGMFENRWIKKQLESAPPPLPAPRKKKGKGYRRR